MRVGCKETVVSEWVPYLRKKLSRVGARWPNKHTREQRALSGMTATAALARRARKAQGGRSRARGTRRHGGAAGSTGRARRKTGIRLGLNAAETGPPALGARGTRSGEPSAKEGFGMRLGRVSLGRGPPRGMRVVEMMLGSSLRAGVPASVDIEEQQPILLVRPLRSGGSLF